MKFVIQRVNSATVEILDNEYSSIQPGFIVFIIISNTATTVIAHKMIRNSIAMRIFEDANGKANLSLKDVNGSLLLVSQFTLYADCKKGNRPSFINAMEPIAANEIYEYIIKECKQECSNVQTGRFGADMKITLQNNGPFTIVLDSYDLI